MAGVHFAKCLGEMPTQGLDGTNHRLAWLSPLGQSPAPGLRSSFHGNKDFFLNQLLIITERNHCLTCNLRK